MDQELRAYLQEMEARMEARADEREARLEARMGQRLVGLEARVDGRLEVMDGRLEAMDGRLGAMDGRLEKVETEGRQTRILLEGMHDNIRLLAEGVMGVTERLEEHQAATARSFQEVKAMLSPYYKNLDGRAQSLEDDVQCLDRRVRVLEAKGDRQTQDVLDVIREKFGKPQS